jgi:trehalose-6-phosphate synthase
MTGWPRSASRGDNTGAVVLSEFVGAASDLQQALLVNPYDLESIKRTMVRAVGMSLGEQRVRMSAMRGHVGSYDFRWWLTSFLEQLASAGSHRAVVKAVGPAAP